MKSHPKQGLPRPYFGFLSPMEHVIRDRKTFLVDVFFKMVFFNMQLLEIFRVFEYKYISPPNRLYYFLYLLFVIFPQNPSNTI